MTGHPPSAPVRVSLTVPSDASMVRIVRLAAGGLASMVDFDIERIDDLKIAIAEGCSALIAAGAGPTLAVELTIGTDRGVTVDTSTTGPDDRAENDEGWSLSRRILGVIADDLDIDLDGPQRRIAFTVRPQERIDEA